MKHDLKSAHAFLEWIDDFAEQFTFQTFDDNKERSDRYLLGTKHGSLKELGDSFRALNKKGAAICFTVNETDLKGRSKSNILAPRAIFIDDDGGVTEPPIQPNIVVHTSLHKRHLYYLLDPGEWSIDEYEQVLKALVNQFGGDRGASDIARALRLPGFFHMKDKNNPYLVHAELIDDKPKTKEEILGVINVEPPDSRTRSQLEREFDERDIQEVEDALSHVPSDDRDFWIRSGIALKNDFGQDGFDVWEKWSQTSTKYVRGECEEKWGGFNGEPQIHKASIFYEAKKHGYKPTPSPQQQTADYRPEAFGGKEIEVFNAADFEGQDIPIQEFAIQDLLISKAPASLYGDPGVGKSTLALQMCATMALGEKFMGFQTTEAKCLILSCEDDLHEIHRRLNRICEENAWSFSDFGHNLFLCCRAGQDNLFIDNLGQGQTVTKTGFYEQLLGYIRDENFDFLVIDNIANVFGGNENDRSDTTRFMTPIYELCVSADITVLLLGHPPKSKVSGSFSGSTAWEATVRQRFNLKNEDDTYKLVCEKANYIKVGTEIKMFKNSEGIFTTTEPLGSRMNDFDFDDLKEKIGAVLDN